MSRSQITCPNRDCRRPLADRRHSGHFVIYSDVRSVRYITSGLELQCPACGTRRVLRPPEASEQAA